MSYFSTRVIVHKYDENFRRIPFIEGPLVLCVLREKTCLEIILKDSSVSEVLRFNIDSSTDSCAGKYSCYYVELAGETIHLSFEAIEDLHRFKRLVKTVKQNVVGNASQRSKEIDGTCVENYFMYYSSLYHQQNMLQDHIRTDTYYNAVMSNCVDFHNKIVLDVGAGSGILSFFAAHAGAQRVYAVEASGVAYHAKRLITNNNLDDKIFVIKGLMEAVELPEIVDVIISEPIGTLLFNERMLETFLRAKKWLRSGGKLYPSRANLYVAPFSDSMLYQELMGRASFWNNGYFYGINLSSLYSEAKEEVFGQPVVDTFDISICLAEPSTHMIDFYTICDSDLHKIDIPLDFQVTKSGVLHGLAFWFDVFFDGTNRTVRLSTSPTEPLTHWYQVRCFVNAPLHVCRGQNVKGHVILDANDQKSYYITIDLHVDGQDVHGTNYIDLKNPYFRFYSQNSANTCLNNTLQENSDRGIPSYDMKHSSEVDSNFRENCCVNIQPIDYIEEEMVSSLQLPSFYYRDFLYKIM